MRPIQLKLKGIHSYRELQEVDFETLCEAGLFGIFGPTGSGKSTILDAITLALYGQVARIGGSSHPQQVLNQLEERLFVSFTFELGGAGERKRYTVEREFGVDKKGNKRPPEVRLIERGMLPGEPDKVLESKATAATAAVERLIGLTIQDFTRAVVLPQGQFSRFLTLKGSERNEMLQRIFHLHEYGEKLNERIRSVYESNKADLHRMELELAALGDAGPEALQAAASEVEAVVSREQEVSMQREALLRKKRELEQIRDWEREREAIQRKLASLRDEQVEIDVLAKRIVDVEKSLQLWPQLERQKQLETEWTEVCARGERERAEREQAVRLLEAAGQVFEAAQSRLRAEEPGLLERKTALSVALEWEKELASLAQEMEADERAQSELERETRQAQAAFDEAQTTAARLHEEQKLLEEQLSAYAITAEQRQRILALLEAKKAWDRERVKLAELKREAEEMEKQLRSIRARLDAERAAWQNAAREREHAQQLLAEAEQKAGELAGQSELEERRDVLAQVRAIGKEWRELNRAKEAWQAKFAEWRQSWEAGRRKVEAAEAAWRKQEALRVECERQKQEAEWARSEWLAENMASVLRRSLADGQPCPVCGSTHHPRRRNEESGQDEPVLHDGEDVYLQRLEKANAAVAEAQRKAQAAYEELQAAKVEQAGLKQRERSLLEEQADWTRREDEIKGELLRFGEGWAAANVDELVERFRQEEAELRTYLNESEWRRKRVEELRLEATGAREREMESKNRYDQSAARLSQLEEAYQSLQQRLALAEDSVGQAERELSRQRGETPVEHIEQMYSHMLEQDEQYERNRNKQAEVADLVRRAEQDCHTWKERLSALAVKSGGVRERLAERRQLYGQKRQQWLERTGGREAVILLGEIDRKLEMLREEANRRDRERQAAVQQFQAAHEALVKTEEALAQLSRRKEEGKLAIEHSLRESGLGEIGYVTELVAERDHLPMYRERVERFRTQLAQLEYDERRLGEQLAGRSVDEAEWAALVQAVEEMELAAAAVRDQVAVAKETLNRIEANHQKWLELHQRYTAVAEEQSRLEDLRKLFEAKAFVQFIAEEKLASIARDASWHLARMTKNRYALEIGAEGEFVLRDEGAGGLLRPVNTLSGGETFLTSLALALALSVEIQMRGGKLEFFFLDEGFGTLDPELLEVVLDALERLRMDRFAIGLISHVPELRVRMPRRLVITPAEPMGRGSRIHMECD